MYSVSFSQLKLEKALDGLKAKGRSVRIQRLEVSQSMEWQERLKSAVKVEEGSGGKPQYTTLRSLTRIEQEFIRSERMLCMYDFRYWLRYHKILSWDGQKYVQMVPNTAQKIVLDLIAEHEEKEHAIKLQILKARQLGITTLMEAIAEHRTMFYPNTRAIVGSATPEKSAKMVMMVEGSWDLMPWWLMPQMTVRKTGEYIEFGELGSNLSIRHGAQKGTDVGRGETPNFAHLSEIVEWGQPQMDIDAGLLMAMHPNPMMFLALESTAGFINDWWHQQWKDNKAHLGNLSLPPRMYPIFLPWFIGREIYPTETELRQHPVPKDWKPSALTSQHSRRAEEYVRDTGLLRHHMGESWKMPVEQQWYWEYTRDYFKRVNELNIFLREMPANDVEAFNSKYSSVFDAEVVEHYSLASRRPERVFALGGPDIRPELQPDRREIDVNLKPLTIDKKWQLLPLKLDGYPSMINPEGKIFVWELPKDNQNYGLGVDTAKGIGQDSSVIEVIRKATVDLVPRQVCEFAHSYISANDLFPWTNAIARLYSVKHAIEGGFEIKQPKLAIETNNGGDATQLAMRKAGWYNFHQWIRYDKKIINESKANFLGFVMVEWARDIVVGGLIKALKDNLIDIDSPWFLEEMSQMEKNEEKRRIEAGNGSHDDRFMALGMVLASLHALDWTTIRSPFGRSRVEEMQVEGLPEEEEKFVEQPKRASFAELALKGFKAEEEVQLPWKEGGYGEGEWQDTAPHMDYPAS